MDAKDLLVYELSKLQASLLATEQNYDRQAIAGECARNDCEQIYEARRMLGNLIKIARTQEL